MANTQNLLKHHDPRVGKTYAVLVAPDCPPELAFKRMVEMAEHDYQKSLPPAKRAIANQDASFACPRCKTHQQPTTRKQEMKRGWLFGFHSYLQDVFTCRECKNEFTNMELAREREEVRRNNWRAECLERYLDGEITEEVLVSMNRL